MGVPLFPTRQEGLTRGGDALGRCLRSKNNEGHPMDEQKLGLGQRWSQARPTETGVFFSAVVTMIVGFTWG
jgi:hypothetical protein